MSFVRGLLRVYSWIFEGILCLMAIGIGMVTLISSHQNLQIGWLPWTGKALPVWIMALGAIGLLSVLMAIFGTLRILLFLFSLFVLVLLVKGFFYGFGYSFESSAQARNAMVLTCGAFLAAIGAWPTASPRTIRRSYR